MSQTERVSYGYVSDKDALVKRLHRIEGQVRGIERMVADERYCIDILTQISAVNTALEAMKRSGELRRIYRRYNILDTHQDQIGV